MSSRRTSWSLVALFTAGYLATYLLPTVVSRLDAGLHLRPAAAGLIGSALLLGSASAGFLLAGRVDRLGPAAVARAGLLLAAVGYGTAALWPHLATVVAGVMVGGFGSGTATTVAAARIAGEDDPHRTSTAGLFGVSALAGLLYLTIPRFGGGHALPFAALAVTALLTLPAAGRLRAADGAAAEARASEPGPLPFRRAGLVLAGGMLLWSMAQNSLWGVSGRIGLDQAGMSEVAVGAVFAAALGAGLLGVVGAGALGSRLGRAVPTAAGTALIGCCIVVTACATTPVVFASGQITWNTLYPVVLSYLIGLAASLDPRGRWAALVGSASALGTACGPVVGSVLSSLAGYRGMGLLLCAGLMLLVVPLTGVTLHTAGRPLLPGAIRRRGGLAGAFVAGATGAPAPSVPQVGAPEQEVVEIAVPVPRLGQRAYGPAGPHGARGGTSSAGG
ncbi:MFS transporter [Streptomyces sp. NA04227]|uniref:MFS transporter n=1 Tax=Streptomyces sp. NA04227 TaxID=2742136 RepID=UPI00158FF96A|nr:MFS transporter [Streptomyces sp. NA04227]QKW06405.1 MFS transporter [Streptomyces sp. NA04227]